MEGHVYLSKDEFSSVPITWGGGRMLGEVWDWNMLGSSCWEIWMHCQEYEVQIMVMVERMISREEVQKYCGDKIGLSDQLVW